ncbi:MAG: DUF1566 domain-containing protein [Sulfurovum sp.]|nr:DUF1566 domain-containing protein [Sulfurovum sp.]
MPYILKVNLNIILNRSLSFDDDAPVFTSEDNVTVEDNQNEAIILLATDENNVTYSISGGDSASFTVNESNQTVTINIYNLDDTAPDKVELLTLVDDTKSNSSISDVFENTQASTYWSASSYSNLPRDAWGINFGNGATERSSKYNLAYVRCVRSSE